MLRIILFLILSSFGVSQAQVLATVGTKKITLQEFSKKYSRIKKQTINPPTPRVFLEDLIRFEMGVIEAEKKGLRNDPVVKDQFRQELYKAFVEKSIGQKVQNIKVSTNEMKRFYKNNPEIRTRHILVEHTAGATSAQITAARKRALEIYTEVKNSKRPFAESVQLYSDDGLSKQRGGDIGWQSKVTLVPTYYSAAIGLKKNQLFKGIVRTKYGFHILKLTGIRSYTNANKQQIRAAVFDEKRRQVFNKLFVKLKKNYSININSQALRKASK